ncbi:MAG: hypothetical protein HQ515_20650 [Phycisphaeraceae bacterium]|nr:hypothetical protein [Phycisphaeraceae bacterium]
MRKKINCKVIQSRRLDISHTSSDARNESSNAHGQASRGTYTARYASAYHGHSGFNASQVDSYA